jgi:hypothetical protein
MSCFTLRPGSWVRVLLLPVGWVAVSCQPMPWRGASALPVAAGERRDPPSALQPVTGLANQRERIAVEVVDPAKPHVVGGARVAVISEECHELGVGIVDGTGLGSVEFDTRGGKPKWVLATKPGYFIGGVPYRGVRGRYYIDLPTYREPPPTVEAEKTDRPAAPVRVEVHEAKRGWPVGGTRITVFSDDCQELASSLTDEEGKAGLPAVPRSDRPRFVLALRDGYFIAGVPWEEGRRRYWIDLPIYYMRRP